MRLKSILVLVMIFIASYLSLPLRLFAQIYYGQKPPEFSVGRLEIKRSQTENPRVCHFSVVGPGLLLTARHCVIDRKTMRTDFALYFEDEQIFFIPPHEMTVLIASPSATSNQEKAKDGGDIALILLSGQSKENISDRTPLKVNTKKISFPTPVHFTHSNRANNSFTPMNGNITQRLSKKHQNFLVFDILTENGDSGSALISNNNGNDGEILAVVAKQIIEKYPDHTDSFEVAIDIKPFKKAIDFLNKKEGKINQKVISQATLYLRAGAKSPSRFFLF